MKDYAVTATKSVATPIATSGTVVTPAATSFATVAEFDDSGSDYSSDDDLSDEEIQEAYKEMYNNLIQKAVINCEFLAAEKEKKLQETRLELENMQKSLKMLNSSTSKLDHILSIEKSSSDHCRPGYIGETSSSKTVVAKGTSIHKPSPQSGSSLISQLLSSWHYVGVPHTSFLGVGSIFAFELLPFTSLVDGIQGEYELILV
ncbi:hypothetical protein TIFTF001_037686 [Ficus carica]|uniref:Uncharacterized protein n=1 Tax=Ficus carica TaxID=3494 RepID=A0AA88E976_FICCA|nr:hypothetical protein TIFTF001_037686 [Ficus carica]